MDLERLIPGHHFPVPDGKYVKVQSTRACPGLSSSRGVARLSDIPWCRRLWSAWLFTTRRTPTIAYLKHAKVRFTTARRAKIFRYMSLAATGKIRGISDDRLQSNLC